jgi:hypothetical protein
VADLGAVFGTLGIIVGPFLGYLGARFAARQSAKAAAATAAVTSRQVDVSEWTAIVEALRTEVTRLGERVAGLEADREADRAKREGLEAEIRRHEGRHWSLIGYVRELLTFAKREAPHATPPPVPHDFVDDLY